MNRILKIAAVSLLVFSQNIVCSAWNHPDPVPPSDHPRLYIRPEEVPGLKERLEHPTVQKCIVQLQKAAIDRTPEEEAKETDRGFRYYFKMRGLTSKVQLQALHYLVDGNEAEGREAVETLLDSLKRTNFGRKNDLSRASGVMLMVGGMVYDWCYPLISADEKQQFIKEFIRIAGTMESGYPPKRNEPIAGHCSEWMILRDMLSCGIAIYDEYPDMYNYVISMLKEDYIAPRNFIYAGGNYHQGTSYVNVRLSNDLICQWIMSKMGAGDTFSRQQQNVMYDFIYRRRPDGQVLPAGDTNHSRANYNSYSLPFMLAASYYGDPYLQYQYNIKQGLEPHCLMFRILWQDLTLNGKDPSDLPLSRFSGTPFGWMIARTAWDDNSVICEMKVNENYVGNHQHMDGGSFQIYYRGPLAIDSGHYQAADGGYNSPNNKEYTKRTVAHNSLLIYDPDEVFECYRYGGEGQTPTAGNEGGQRMPGIGWDTCRSFKDLLSDEFTVGKTLASGFGPSETVPEYTLLKGDITKAYSKKVSDVRRSFVFLNLASAQVPAALLVFDHVVSANPSFKKTWLLHSIEEPVLEDGAFTVRRTLNGDSGMLRCDVLWPTAPALEKIGGPGKEFWVNGVNYFTMPRAKDPEHEDGQWRVEESPSEASAEDIFLNVIQVAGNNCKSLNKVAKIDSDSVAGAVLADRVVTFSKSGELLDGEFTFSIPAGKKAYKILVTDLESGRWIVKRNGKALKGSFYASDDSMSLYFTAAPGDYTLKFAE